MKLNPQQINAAQVHAHAGKYGRITGIFFEADQLKDTANYGHHVVAMRVQMEIYSDKTRQWRRRNRWYFIDRDAAGMMYWNVSTGIPNNALTFSSEDAAQDAMRGAFLPVLSVSPSDFLPAIRYGAECPDAIDPQRVFIGGATLGYIATHGNGDGGPFWFIQDSGIESDALQSAIRRDCETGADARRWLEACAADAGPDKMRALAAEAYDNQ